MTYDLIAEAREPLADARELLSLPVEQWTRGSAEMAEGIVAAYVDNVPAILARLEAAEAKLARMVATLDEISDLNMSCEDENGHCWADNDLINQAIVLAKIAALQGEG